MGVELVAQTTTKLAADIKSTKRRSANINDDIVSRAKRGKNYDSQMKESNIVSELLSQLEASETGFNGYIAAILTDLYAVNTALAARVATLEASIGSGLGGGTTPSTGP